ncbi:MAG: hypothetical protein MI867_19265 [Pseudomonadales bacterium]|nr:hypothetical protein [Pseudomonadales bacterium]
MFQQRTWILQRSNIELLRDCQRFVSDQFSEKLSLTQTDLLEKIFYFSTQTQNKPFHETVERLKHSLVEAAFDITTLPGCEPAAADAVIEADAGVDEVEDLQSAELVSVDVAPTKPKRKRMYRGREVIVDEPIKVTAKETVSADVETLKGEDVTEKVARKRIYRGRVVG